MPACRSQAGTAADAGGAHGCQRAFPKLGWWMALSLLIRGEGGVIYIFLISFDEACNIYIYIYIY